MYIMQKLKICNILVCMLDDAGKNSNKVFSFSIQRGKNNTLKLLVWRSSLNDEDWLA